MTVAMIANYNKVLPVVTQGPHNAGNFVLGLVYLWCCYEIWQVMQIAIVFEMNVMKIQFIYNPSEQASWCHLAGYQWIQSFISATFSDIVNA